MGVRKKGKPFFYQLRKSLGLTSNQPKVIHIKELPKSVERAVLYKEIPVPPEADRTIGIYDVSEVIKAWRMELIARLVEQDVPKYKLLSSKLGIEVSGMPFELVYLIKTNRIYLITGNMEMRDRANDMLASVEYKTPDGSAFIVEVPITVVGIEWEDFIFIFSDTYPWYSGTPPQDVSQDFINRIKSNPYIHQYHMDGKISK